MAENSVSGKEGKVLGKLGRDLHLNLELDVSEALTGLKAVQREAKEAVKALRDLESVNQKYTLTPEERERIEKEAREGVGQVGIFKSGPPIIQRCIESFSNEELIKELSGRTGVTPIHIEPNQKANLRIPSVKQSFEITGPSTIFITE